MNILIIRFSSIGDIVLTSPIIRSLRTAYPDAELHYLTKAQYRPLLSENPHIDHLHVLKDDLRENIRTLKQVGITHIVDLHNNLRSWRVGLALGVSWRRFPKLNRQKFLLTNFKVNRLPDMHIVERYARAMPKGTALDTEGLAFYCSESAEAAANSWMRKLPEGTVPVGVVLGGKFATKQWPAAYHRQLLKLLDAPVILFGGPDEAQDAQFILDKQQRADILNTVGKIDLQTAAALIRGCKYVITNDTGLMHIAAAMHIPTYVIWGNTLPEFGMYPYRAPHANLEVEGLKCRPCSKLGHTDCPKTHFRCMREQTPERVLTLIQNNPL